ncbi:uncharacterized protein LOC136042463 [Artemia franciscana]|uniref:Uncharacterized protein n=1 Tax=Artemia franciscana TaxID=6661 RepID=A0AA88KUH3_ARTSF|nr:hypothetical protein QYM36_018740 [Artemia franciscana]
MCILPILFGILGLLFDKYKNFCTPVQNCVVYDFRPLTVVYICAIVAASLSLITSFFEIGFTVKIVKKLRARDQTVNALSLQTPGLLLNQPLPQWSLQSTENVNIGNTSLSPYQQTLLAQNVLPGQQVPHQASFTAPNQLYYMPSMTTTGNPNAIQLQQIQRQQNQGVGAPRGRLY